MTYVNSVKENNVLLFLQPSFHTISFVKLLFSDVCKLFIEYQKFTKKTACTRNNQKVPKIFFLRRYQLDVIGFELLPNCSSFF